MSVSWELGDWEGDWEGAYEEEPFWEQAFVLWEVGLDEAENGGHCCCCSLLELEL